MSAQTQFGLDCLNRFVWNTTISDCLSDEECQMTSGVRRVSENTSQVLQKTFKGFQYVTFFHVSLIRESFEEFKAQAEFTLIVVDGTTHQFFDTLHFGFTVMENIVELALNKLSSLNAK